MPPSYTQLLDSYSRGHETAVSAIGLVQALVECRETARRAAARAHRMGNPPQRVRLALGLAKSSLAPLFVRAVRACRDSEIDFRAAYREVYARTSVRIARRRIDRIQPQRQAVPA